MSLGPDEPLSEVKQRELERERLGQFAVQLAIRFPEWVRRRRFAIDYVDDTTIRQRMSVDFMVPRPEWFWFGPPPRRGETIYVPLHLPRKETLTNFSVFDEEGKPLSTLITQENGALATAGLFPFAREFAAIHHPMPDDALRAVIEEIVMAPKTPDCDPVEDVLAPHLEDELGKVFVQESEPKALLRDLAGGFMLLVPVEYRESHDRVFKLEWEFPNFWHGRTDGNPLFLSAQSFLASIGWADKRQNIPDLQLGWARSTHVEVIAPPEVELTAAALNVEQYDPRHRSPVPVDALRTCFDQPRINLNTSIRVKDDAAAPAETDRAWTLARGDSGSVDLRLRTPAGNVLLAATVASIVTSVLLWLVAGRLAELDGQTSSAVLLVAPAIVAAFLARPGEHAFATRLLVGVRMCALGVGLCSLAVAAIIGLATLERSGAGARGLDAVIRCVERTEPARARRRAAAEDRRSLGCQVLERDVPSLDENPVAERWVRRIAAVSSVLAGVLLVGFLRTWLFADLRHRNRKDQIKPFPSAPAANA